MNRKTQNLRVANKQRWYCVALSSAFRDAAVPGLMNTTLRMSIAKRWTAETRFAQTKGTLRRSEDRCALW